MNTNLVDLPRLAGVEISLPLLSDIVKTAPYDKAQLSDATWKKESACAAILKEANDTTLKATLESAPTSRNAKNIGKSNSPIFPKKPEVS